MIIGWLVRRQVGSLLLFGTLRLVTSELKTTVDYFSVHLCWLVLCVGMVTSGHPAGYFRVCLVSLLLEPVVYVYERDSWLLLWPQARDMPVSLDTPVGYFLRYVCQKRLSTHWSTTSATTLHQHCSRQFHLWEWRVWNYLQTKRHECACNMPTTHCDLRDLTEVTLNGNRKRYVN